jgi:hypothetical protein
MSANGNATKASSPNCGIPPQTTGSLARSLMAVGKGSCDYVSQGVPLSARPMTSQLSHDARARHAERASVATTRAGKWALSIAPPVTASMNA